MLKIYNSPTKKVEEFKPLHMPAGWEKDKNVVWQKAAATDCIAFIKSKDEINRGSTG